jgi:hypothetical protein
MVPMPVPSPTRHVATAAAPSGGPATGFFAWLRGNDTAPEKAVRSERARSEGGSKPHRPFFERWLGIGADDDDRGAVAATTSQPAPAIPQRRPRTAYYDPQR